MPGAGEEALVRVRHRSMSRLPSLASACCLVLMTTQARAAPLCTPDLAVVSTQFSEVRAGRRVWTARIAVDASPCATSSGRFFIRFVRTKEDSPDLPFSEPFTWQPGVIEASMSFAADEAVLDFSIGYVRPCACRVIGSR